MTLLNQTTGAGLSLADRLANTDLETGNILNWGSPCFFE